MVDKITKLQTTEELQEEIVRLLLSNKVFYFSVSNHLLPKAFVSDYGRIISALVAYEDKYHTYPSGKAFRDFADKLFRSYGWKEDNVSKLIEDIQQYQASGTEDIDEESIAYYIHLIKRHKAQHNVVNMFREAGSLLEDQTSDLTQLTTMIYDAVSPLLENDTEEVTDLLDPDTLKQNLDEVYSNEEHNKYFRTGIPKIDNLVLRGGLNESQLGIFIGATGSGKSFMLQNCALMGALDGYKVLHINCEMNSSSMVDRFYRAMSARTHEEIKNDLDGAYQILANNINLFKQESDSQLVTWKAAENKSIMGIENRLRRDKLKGKEWDLLVIDYADELVESGNTQDWEKVLNVYRGLKRIMDIYKVGIWTASQMESMAAVQMALGERDVITSYDQAHSKRKAYYMDYGFAMKQTAEEDESGKIRISITKARHSAKISEVVIYKDFDRASFKTEMGDI